MRIARYAIPDRSVSLQALSKKALTRSPERIVPFQQAMEFFDTSSAPSYYIYRDVAAGKPFDPTAPLHFFPPKDSDELWIALRNAFPHAATHSERMRNAVIQFLMTEGQTQQAASTQPSPIINLEASFDLTSNSTSPYSPYTSIASSASSSRTRGSPRFSAPSPATTEPLQRTNSQSGTGPSMNGIDGMTSVFSLNSLAQPKLRTRRKMTEGEKAEYRKRRTAGACQSCSARKRKCKHNKDRSTPATPSLTHSADQKTSKPLSKKQGKQVAKKTSPPATAVHHQATQQIGLQVLDTTPDLLSFDDKELFTWHQDADWSLLDMEAPVLPQMPLQYHLFPRASLGLGLSPRSPGLSTPQPHGQDHEGSLQIPTTDNAFPPVVLARDYDWELLGHVRENILPISSRDHDRVAQGHSALILPIPAYAHDRQQNAFTRRALPEFARGHGTAFDIRDANHEFGTEGGTITHGLANDAQQPPHIIHAHAALGPYARHGTAAWNSSLLMGSSHGPTSGGVVEDSTFVSQGRGGISGNHAWSPWRMATSSPALSDRYSSRLDIRNAFSLAHARGFSHKRLVAVKTLASFVSSVVRTSSSNSVLPAMDHAVYARRSLLPIPLPPSAPNGLRQRVAAHSVHLGTETIKISIDLSSSVIHSVPSSLDRIRTSDPAGVPSRGRSTQTQAPLLPSRLLTSAGLFAGKDVTTTRSFSMSHIAALVQLLLQVLLGSVSASQMFFIWAVLQRPLHLRTTRKVAGEKDSRRCEDAVHISADMCWRSLISAA